MTQVNNQKDHSARNEANFISSITLDILPQDCINQIFLELDSFSIQSFVYTNRKMKDLGITAERNKEFYLTKKFIDFLISNLKEKKFSQQKTSLKNIKQNFIRTIITNEKENPISINLLFLKKNNLETKQNVINILKTLDEHTLEKLQSYSIQLPSWMESIFQVAIVQVLLQQKDKQDCLDKAINITDLIMDETIRGPLLEEIVEILVEQSRIRKAIEVAKTLRVKFFRERLLVEMATNLIQSNPKIALEIAKIITDEDYKDPLLEEIARSLLQRGGLDNVNIAIQVIRLITSSFYKGPLIHKICNTLSLLGYQYRADALRATMMGG